MKATVRLAFFLIPFAALVGCNMGEAAASGNVSGDLTQSQQENAKTLGIATPDSVKQDAGAYGGSVGYAKSVVDAQRAQAASQAAVAKTLSESHR